jgi:hypothetical protein
VRRRAKHISTDFAGHDFALLIAEILKAQGYTVNVSLPGADKGIDIVAGIGTLGFDQPRLVVQVKSGNIVADQQTLQALLGAVHDVQGSQGLLVCWGGFTKPVEQRRNELFFRIRLGEMAYLKNLARRLYERRHQAAMVPHEHCSDDRFHPEAGACHANVDQWCRINPTHRPIRGWLMFDHSAVGRFLFVDRAP